MSEAKHGRWRRSLGAFVRTDNEDRTAVASVYGENGAAAYDDKTAIARADLIAAAPDLLEAAELQQAAELIWGNCPECQETQNWPELCEHCFESADKARVARMNAIAKATGEGDQQ